VSESVSKSKNDNELENNELINFEKNEGTKMGTKVETKMIIKLLEIVDLLIIDKTREDLLTGIGLSKKTQNFNNYIKPLIEFDIIEMTIPNKPNSQNQKYRLTAKGRKLLK